MANSPASKSRKQRAAIYREAARRLEAVDVYSHYSCDMLGRVCGHFAPGGYTEASRELFKALKAPYIELFEPKKTRYGSGGWWPLDEVDQRVLALCFMAAIIETGDA